MNLGKYARLRPTAGPRDAFKTRNWIPPKSVIRPINPSNASISRIKWPFPMPPIEGYTITTNSIIRVHCRTSRRSWRSLSWSEPSSLPYEQPPRQLPVQHVHLQLQQRQNRELAKSTAPGSFASYSIIIENKTPNSGLPRRLSIWMEDANKLWTRCCF